MGLRTQSAPRGLDRARHLSLVFRSLLLLLGFILPGSRIDGQFVYIPFRFSIRVLSL